jgi:hypothetical protein
MRQYISYDYLKDMHFDKLKQVELLNDQLSVLRDASEYVGKYFSIEYVRKVILGQTEEDIARIDKEIMDEMTKEQIKDPDAPPSPFGFESVDLPGPEIVPSGEKDVLTINTETEIVEQDASTLQ